MKVTCPYCEKPADLVRGRALYPHRADLWTNWFWRCEACDASVGCHKRGAWAHGVTSDGTLPLGALANRALRRARGAAHEAFDGLWKSKQCTRTEAYAWLAREMRISPSNCHIAMMDTEACLLVCRLVLAYRAGEFDAVPEG